MVAKKKNVKDIGKVSEKELEKEIESIEKKNEKNKGSEIKRNIKSSKPISQLKKGDKVKIDGKEYVVDAHYVLIDHGDTKEMVIELFDEKEDKDLQLRYFDDQVESTLELYELKDIMYFKKPFSKIEW